MQFRLRTLLIVLTVAAALLVIYREIRGRIEFESPVSTGSSPLIVFHVTTPEETLSLREQFDQQAFAGQVQDNLQRAMRRENLDPIDFSLHVMNVTDVFCFKFNYQRMGRRRFDVRTWRYHFDDADPVARARNDAIERAFYEASKDWAKGRSDVAKELSGALLELDETVWPVAANSNPPAPGAMPQPPFGATATGGPFSTPPDAAPPTKPVKVLRRPSPPTSPFAED